MKTDLTIQTSSTSPPIPLARRVLDGLASFENAMEARGVGGYLLPAERAPTEAQRAFLARRAVELDAALAPAPAKILEAELLALFTVCAFRNADEGDAKAVSAIYRADLADLPGFALAAACGHFRRMSKWVPTIAELRARAALSCDPFRQERARIAKVLDAHVLPPADDGVTDRKAFAERMRRELSEAVAATQVEEKRRPLTPRSHLPPPVEEPKPIDFASPCHLSDEALRLAGVKPVTVSSERVET
jgi:hypothetical protein